MKRLIALLLAMVFVFSTAACGAKSETAAGTETPGAEAGTPAAEGAEAGGAEEAGSDEPIEMHAYFFEYPSYSTNYEKAKESPVYNKLVEETGVKLVIEGVDADRASVILAGGDTTDLANFIRVEDVTDAMESGLLLPLNDLIEEYAPNIAELMPDRLQAAKDLFSDEDGNFYAIPVNAGNTGGAAKIDSYMYNIRWDLYAEMGYPEIADQDEFLEMLVEMQELHPETEDGLPTYGLGFAMDNGKTMLFDQRFWYTYGYRGANSFAFTDVETGEFVYNYTDVDSPYWQAAEFYNKAYRLGILDPDSLTQKSADYQDKVLAGQYLAPWRDLWSKKHTAAVLAEDPESTIGYGAIYPTEEVVYAEQYGNQDLGWEMYFMTIPATCKDPVAMIKLLDYTFSYEGSRLLNSGLEGVHWEIVDGEVRPTEFGCELYAVGGDVKSAEGVESFDFFSGLQDGTICPDGGPVNMKKSEYYFETSVQTPSDIAYCEYFGVDYPAQVFSAKVQEGTAIDASSLNFALLNYMSGAPEDIMRIDTNLEAIAVRAVPELVTAESEEAFEELKAQYIAELNEAGAEESREYWADKHASICEQYGIK